jgi:hypothetical protein
MAAALRHARGSLSQREWADALRDAGYPASEDMVSGWELGADPETVSSVTGITIVPAWALVGAAKVSRRSVGELLMMAGVEGQEPLHERVDQLQFAYEAMKAALDELRADRGLPPLPELLHVADD